MNPHAEVLDLVVGSPAHGGSCVARGPDGRVVFVRHALPGEHVRAEVTATRSSFRTADAVQIVSASPDRVEAPCRFAGPGGCGGCDLQHVSLSAQRGWKAAVITEQFARLARLDVAVPVEPLPDAEPAAPGLGWRTRVSYAVDAHGRPGLHPFHSHDVLAIDECLLADHTLRDTDVLARSWPGAKGVEVAVDDDAAVRVTTSARRAAPRVAGRKAMRHRVFDRTYQVHGFWQVHPHAAHTLAAAVLDGLAPRPGERALDLYAGAGLFAGVLAGAGASVLAVEGGRRASLDTVANCAGLPVEVWHGQVDEALAEDLGRVDVVVLDPPRTGAGRDTVAAIARLGARAIAYVACDPAALARDVATFGGHGYRLTALRAFDLFPMTHHVECVAVLEPGLSPDGPESPARAR